MFTLKNQEFSHWLLGCVKTILLNINFVYIFGKTENSHIFEFIENNFVKTQHLQHCCSSEISPKNCL